MNPFKKITSNKDKDSSKSRSPSPSASPVFPIGIQVLHDCAGATVDICFVHGLGGNRETTWTFKGASTPWPETLLHPEIHDARILTYGYDAAVVRLTVASSSGLIVHAQSLLTHLTAYRAKTDTSSRPLVFVAHSLGGLVCKRAILSSRNDPEVHLQSVFECIKGIIFMGTPHRGSWMADWAKISSSALGLLKSTNTSLLSILQTNNELLQSVQGDFWKMIRGQRENGRRLEVTCFFEQKALSVVGKVVSEESATLEGYTAIGIDANHMDMTKFSSAGDPGFICVLAELTRWIKEVRSNGGTRILSPNGSIKSDDGRYNLDLQSDGNLVLYHLNEAPIWSTDTRGKAISGLMLENGNLVLYDADNKPCWRTDLENYQGARLVVQNDGNMVIYHGDRAAWTSETQEKDCSGVSIRKTIQLSQNEMVNSNESVVSKNGRYSLVLWSDGNLVLYHGGKAPVWKRQSESGKAISHLIMQEDGDLVLKDVDNIPSWQSHTDQHHGARFVVQDDGNMVIYHGDRPIWASHTQGRSIR
ncbi:bulb-type lectin domain-containing protein [Lipomyces doorenjongii]